MTVRTTPNWRWLKTACLLLLATALADGVKAQLADFPTKTVKIISDSAPGSAVDTSLRIIAEGLSRKWGQQVVIENRPGAGGAISATAAAEAAADGYTIYAPALSIFLTIPGKAPNLGAGGLAVQEKVGLECIVAIPTPSSVSGNVMPSTFCVIRLVISSTFTEFRVGHQRRDRQDARPHRAGHAALDHRRGDRMSCELYFAAMQRCAIRSIETARGLLATACPQPAEADIRLLDGNSRFDPTRT